MSVSVGFSHVTYVPNNPSAACSQPRCAVPLVVTSLVPLPSSAIQTSIVCRRSLVASPVASPNRAASILAIVAGP